LEAAKATSLLAYLSATVFTLDQSIAVKITFCGNAFVVSIPEIVKRVLTPAAKNVAEKLISLLQPTAKISLSHFALF